MVKHNNVIPNGHFHKQWARYVKTWFNQPARKSDRRSARAAKATRVAPRPLNLLRPVVRGQTLKYNLKIRAGRGFTLDELSAANVSKKAARGIGIAVDHRRKNRNEEAFQHNVNRLKQYKSKLVVFPRKPTSKRLRRGDSTPDDRKEVQQVVDKQVLPIVVPGRHIPARVISPEEHGRSVVALLRKARTDGKLWGQRERRAKLKAEKAAAGDKKAAKAAGGGGGGGGGGDGEGLAPYAGTMELARPAGRHDSKPMLNRYDTAVDLGRGSGVNLGQYNAQGGPAIPPTAITGAPTIPPTAISPISYTMSHPTDGGTQDYGNLALVRGSGVSGGGDKPLF